MLKAFLSHSSKNKDYVEKIAKELTQNWCTYDSFTFEFFLLSSSLIASDNLTTYAFDE